MTGPENRPVEVSLGNLGSGSDLGDSGAVRMSLGDSRVTGVSLRGFKTVGPL